MTQNERWQKLYKEVADIIDANHSNPSEHYDEERNMHTFAKHTMKQMNNKGDWRKGLLSIKL